MNERAEKAGGQNPENTDGFAIRAMRAGDLEAAYELSVAERWPHRLTDWRFAFKLGTGVVAEHEGRIIGTAMAWRWDGAHATVGLLIVDAAHRMQRVADRLLASLLAGLDGRALQLRSPLAARDLFERAGFAGAGTVLQHQGIAKSPPLVAVDPGSRLRPLDHNDLPHITALDARAHGFERAALIRALEADAATIVLDHGGEARGFAMLRRFGRGRIVGPVIAPNAGAAKALIAHLVGLCVGKFVRVDVCDETGLGAWLESIGLQQVGAVAAMARPAAAPPVPTDVRAFALVSQAFG